MANVTLRQEAINDLTEIWNYTIENWSEDQADKYYNSLKLACKKIGEKPAIGKKYSEISEHLLGFKTGKHIIFYYVISTFEIEIIRILHENMDLENRLND